MIILSTLQERGNQKEYPNNEIEAKLSLLALDISSRAKEHLKRVIKILPEFDLHDASHSEKVLYNIESLVGESTIQGLSSYDLFIIYCSSFLHDCAMAPTDWEINLLKQTEGNDNFTLGNPIHNDLKKPFSYTKSHQYILDNKKSIYKDFDEVKGWMFSPQEEKKLVIYLANLLKEYQEFRNGYADKIKNVRKITDYESLNDEIRFDFIRINHHFRIEDYIKNMSSLFECRLGAGWSKKLLNDLAIICRSHGESISYVETLDIETPYFGAETANIQFCSMMLRLGDVIHFSYDRAPVSLRSTRIFSSDFSFSQWAIKGQGVNYSITNHEILFNAFCDTPSYYYKLHEYIDWIDIEIQNYFKLSRKWDKKYVVSLAEKVNRNGIKNDDEIFQPRHGLKFVLDQKSIIELLMGVGLYKDKYACIRELYQNSLDACKCILSQKDYSDKIGEITFGIEITESGRYLYCQDNGIGMSKYIIENYLLKIGNSYYKSSDFYKKQAENSNQFTPTSQFGIGILSCFMIGNKIEITTKMEGEDYISCSIDGPHEYFYYKNSSEFDKEKIDKSGTIIKILLNEDIELSSQAMDKKELPLFLDVLPNFIPNAEKYKALFDLFPKHLYSVITNLVGIVPDNISVYISQEDHSLIPIKSQPFLFSEKEFTENLTEEDLELVNHHINRWHRSEDNLFIITDIINKIETYKIHIEKDNVHFYAFLKLPKNEDIEFDTNILRSIPYACNGHICIDGIFIDSKSHISSIDHYYSGYLTHIGIIDFCSSIRPQLSVDRKSITNYPDDCEKIAKDISVELLSEVIKITLKHIEEYNIQVSGSTYNSIWNYLFKTYSFAPSLFVNYIANSKLGNINWHEFDNVLIENNLSIKEFVDKKEVAFKNYKFKSLNAFTQDLILTKIISSDSIEVTEDEIRISAEKLLKTPWKDKNRHHRDTMYYVCPDKWDINNKEYDIISNKYPVVSPTLFNKLIKYKDEKINKRTNEIHVYGNNSTAIFNQDPVLVHPRYGLYSYSDRGVGHKKPSLIKAFDNKIEHFYLAEINGRGSSDKTKYLLYAFIAPRELNDIEKSELKSLIQDEPEYVKGVQEGWSILITTQEIDDVIVHPGQVNRDVLVNKISDKFWELYKDWTFKFTDGTICSKS
ncbi:hypothetical protein G7051_15665 [Dysgonomonas sp. HDW5B]|uniref:HD domain-containing protein n=1 Tax=Dysgonomonas sp. HDW5B TaxID=2714927 RepID=UPI00140A0808|nr:ATP-binding protein [Dysgonomonas sp. HDW5B]QIK55708.1 hypothetical protein G7051_15665 [Dysgonomonas sp. HDW5B]